MFSGRIGWRGTSFEMVNKQNQTAYHLVFGTGSPKGMEAIKRAMRSALADRRVSLYGQD